MKFSNKLKSIVKKVVYAPDKIANFYEHKHILSLNSLEELKFLRAKLQRQHRANHPERFVSIGDFTYGNPAINIYDDKTSLKIGKFCSIAGVTIMLGGEHRTEWVTTYPFSAFLHHFRHFGYPQTKGDIVIGNDVWIGSGAKIMSGVTIGDGCVVAANAVVTKNIPDYCICGGVPAKIIRQRFSDDVVEKLKAISWWDWADEDICNVIPLLQSEDIAALIRYYEQKQGET
jgi:acetyltransferase-like isoleucine patch superfamily enzyme